MFKGITLEMSIKPFKKTDREYIREVVKNVFEQWRPLIKNREEISIMLWTADGSELLDYSGNLDEEFEWCRFVGGASCPDFEKEDDLRTSLHQKRFEYIKNPPKMTYCILKNIITEFKMLGKEMFPDSTIRVGETFDIGPEFAISDFKYNRHTEISTGQVLIGKGFLNSYGVLDGDTRKYAAYPNGIPDKTPFGEFLGKQTQAFFDSLGFDYLWLSNGVGFSAFPWTSEGAIFDGKNFHVENFESCRNDVFGFWENYRKGCPDYPIETRGTNYSVGIDYASDAVGLYDIYKNVKGVMPPPNSPWAALDKDYGLELMGHLTRICEVPGEDFLFRYYIHDPWWANTPWYDRYEGQPHDIYLPMALSRVNDKGEVKSATKLNILSIDNSFGDLPDSCVNEPLPHILKAEKDASDDLSPLTWVYPFREYTSTKKEEALRKMLAGDWFICSAINSGFPLSSVVSCDNFIKLGDKHFKKTVLVTPVPLKDTQFDKEIIRYAENGGKVLFYGSVTHASEEFRKFFGITLKEGVSGEIKATNLIKQVYRDKSTPNTINVRELICDGKLDSVSKNSIMDVDGGYTLACKNKNAVWFRAIIGGKLSDGHIENDDFTKYISGETLFRQLLENFGYEIKFSMPDPNVRTPIVMINKSDNAMMFSVCLLNTTVDSYLKFPLGAPVFTGYETELVDGYSTYRFPRAVHNECRAFVEQESGVVSICEEIPVSRKYRRRLRMRGLKNATVRFFAESYCADSVEADLNPSTKDDSFNGETEFGQKIMKSDEFGTYFEAKDITGEILFSMPFKNR